MSDLNTVLAALTAARENYESLHNAITSIGQGVEKKGQFVQSTVRNSQLLDLKILGQATPTNPFDGLESDIKKLIRDAGKPKETKPAAKPRAKKPA